MFTFKKIHSGDRELMAVQENAAHVFAALSLVTLLDSVILKNVALANSVSTTINHTLGRTPTGWFIVDRMGVSTVYRTAWNDRTISLTSSAAVTASILVF